MFFSSDVSATNKDKLFIIFIIVPNSYIVGIVTLTTLHKYEYTQFQFACYRFICKLLTSVLLMTAITSKYPI